MFNLVALITAALHRLRALRREVVVRRQIDQLPEVLQRDIGWPRDIGNSDCR